MAKQTDRERIADALYLLAAGANHDVLMDTLRAYVVAHSKEESDVLALLRAMQEAQPTITALAIERVKQRNVLQLMALHAQGVEKREALHIELRLPVPAAVKEALAAYKETVPEGAANSRPN